MRPIKFLALFKDKIWEVQGIRFNDWHATTILDLYFPSTEETVRIARGEAELLEYTGVNDKHGRQIFEGFTIKGLWMNGQFFKGKVVFRNGSFSVKNEKDDSYYAFTYMEEKSLEIC